MENKRRVIVLVTVAAVLAIIAITLNVTGSEDVPTSISGNAIAESKPGQVGIQISEPIVEDKLVENNMEPNQ